MTATSRAMLCLWRANICSFFMILIATCARERAITPGHAKG
jgi:hypothetical protein